MSGEQDESRQTAAVSLRVSRLNSAVVLRRRETFPFSVWCVWRFVSRPRCTPCKDDTEKQRSKLTNTMAAAWGRRGARAPAPARPPRRARARAARVRCQSQSHGARLGGALRGTPEKPWAFRSSEVQ